LVPRFAAVSGFVEAAIRRIAPERAGHRGKDGVTIRWAHGNLCDALRLFQPGTRPRFAAVGRFVDPVTN
jgi:hypothetical protein